MLAAEGGQQVRAAVLGKAIDGSVTERVDCDLIAVSGGWAPAVHLHAMAGSRPVYDPALAAFLPGKPREAWISCGAASGVFALADCLADGARAGAEAARRAGFDSPPRRSRPAPSGRKAPACGRLGRSPRPKRRKVKKFVDLQHDVTAADVALAHREGYVSVEHLKRYTTQGMATDQGKTGNIGALALMAALRGEPIPAVGTTTFRPPFTPVAIGALAGREVGDHFRPTRRTPMHDWHVAHGAEMFDVDAWLRPRIYAKPGETVEQAYVREARAVRAGVGMVDVSTLGKIDVLGPDAAEFLNRVYVNGFKKLPVGKARYGIMLREDGFHVRRRHRLAARRAPLPDDDDDGERGAGAAAPRTAVAGGVAAVARHRHLGRPNSGRGWRSPPPATSTAAPSAMSSSRRRCSRPLASAASARSLAGNTSRSMCASSACRVTARHCPSASAFRAPPTARPRARSRVTASSSRSSKRNPLRYIPEELRHRKDTNAVRIDTNRPMAEIRAELSKYPTTTRLLINGPIIVARDIAHAKLKEMLDAGKPLPDYFKNHPVYYAGPAKTPAGMPSGSFGPTTAGRMDSYVDLFQSHGGSMVMIAKGNRGQQVTDACKKHGGFYLGSIGGPAAILAKENIKKVEVVEFAELGMEAIWKIEVEDFPAFILVDDKGNDFFQTVGPGVLGEPIIVSNKLR